MSELAWRKSSFSGGGNGDCVEVAAGDTGLVHLRESDDPLAVITTTPAALRALLRAAKAGAFDHLAR
ncbi:DUF397 domain-containing protein [Streptomyces sp. So13.3]|uniref:DUF397 domain-containing protein n=1 Tax=Streptomyces TaxID=1883 RepID=UPI001105B80C|nr:MULTISPECIES: DUF397 domain-containing protein [Streptomyces]MCZ4099028.1 DUF397 domain-containing protein [Streptomyces sp. H39-C1]QNA74466.1 DUF397 domain-containing protein [Streptomyces sp. So13.3]